MNLPNRSKFPINIYVNANEKGAGSSLPPKCETRKESEEENTHSHRRRNAGSDGA